MYHFPSPRLLLQRLLEARYSVSKHTALPLQARDSCCCPGWRWKTHAWKAYCQWLIIAVWKPWLLLIKYTFGAAQGFLFSVCDCSHCVFSKHIQPKSFLKTHIQQTKIKQTYITNKQKVTLRNAYSTHTANDNQTQKVMRECVILALMLFVLSSPRTTQPQLLNPGLHLWHQSRVLALISRCFMSCKN